MEPKIFLSLLLVGMIIGFSYLDAASAFLQRRQFAWPRRAAKAAIPRKT
jgi:hypothetical protein